MVMRWTDGGTTFTSPTHAWMEKRRTERERELVINQVGSRGQREAGGKEREREFDECTKYDTSAVDNR